VSITPSAIQAVPTSRKVNGKSLNSDITLAAADVSAVPTSRKVNGVSLNSDITLAAADVSAVPLTRTINGVSLNSDITLEAADVSAVPLTRTINGVSLNSDITLEAADIGAVPASRKVNNKNLNNDIVISTVFENKKVTSSLWTTASVPTAYASAGFPYRAAISGLTGVTTNMVPQVTFSLTDSMSGIFAPIAESASSAVYIYASEIPSGTITIPSIVCISK
jgi:hypothetical protein